MPLSEECQRLIKKWHSAISASGRTLDWERWYDFVDQYSRDHDYSLNEKEVREFIHQLEFERYGRDVGHAFAATINKPISLAFHILEFLVHTKR